MNFLNPLTNSDGEPYGPWRYKEIVKELYVLSKNINTSYTDLLQITPTERGFLIEMLLEESKKTKEALEKAKREREANKRR